MKLNKIIAETALNKLKHPGLPYKYDLNIYKGCTHNCRYCYAQSGKSFLSNDNKIEVIAKMNIAELLDKELSDKNWRGDIINIGGICDSYQPVEEELKLMQDVLKIMIKHKNPVIISTKSELILRDIDLIDKLAENNYVNIPVCITSIQKELTQKIESRASSPDERLNVLKEIGKTKAYTGFHLMPILPYLSDSFQELETLVKWAAESKVDYMLTGMLYLTGGIKKKYMEFLQEYYPELIEDYLNLYPKGGANKNYKTKIHNFIGEMRKRYNVNNNYSKFLPKKYIK